MSTAETKPHEPAPDAKPACPTGEIRNAEGKCVPDPDAEAGPPAETAEKGLFPSVKAVIQDALDATVKEMEDKMTKMMAEQIAKIQKEFAVGLRKELGLSTDPTVTKTELNSAIRKAVLDLKLPDGKKTPASTPLVKAVTSTTKPGDIFKHFGVVA